MRQLVETNCGHRWRSVLSPSELAAFQASHPGWQRVLCLTCDRPAMITKVNPDRDSISDREGPT